MKKILVSACLYGECTRYDGKNNILKHPVFLKWKNIGVLVPVCPEVLGGLPTPRPCSEIKDGKVVNAENADVTPQFELGAQRALEIAKKSGAILAILKQNSPSCGSKNIYDGTFSGRKISGSGICAKLLLESGIPVFDEEDIELANMLWEHANACHGHKN